MSSSTHVVNYYEVLQISRNADSETIHRVYRIMATRFHPDNPKTGDMERFLSLRLAYEVLSDPQRRAQYDAACPANEAEPLPIFELRDFIDGVDGEKNRRLGVLSILYHRRRINHDKAGASVLDLERLMAVPREYLSFTLWYLRSKGYLVMEESSDYALTVTGVDYLESNSSHDRIARELLTAGDSTGAEFQPGVRMPEAAAGNVPAYGD
jgi:hypothetical protein